MSHFDDQIYSRQQEYAYAECQDRYNKCGEIICKPFCPSRFGCAWRRDSGASPRFRILPWGVYENEGI
jgi:hypothetical protein